MGVGEGKDEYGPVHDPKRRKKIKKKKNDLEKLWREPWF